MHSIVEIHPVWMIVEMNDRGGSGLPLKDRVKQQRGDVVEVPGP
jgi:hypothetical protein